MGEVTPEGPRFVYPLALELATRLTALETQLAPAWRASADAWLVEYEAGLRAREEELARSRARELRGDVAREVKRRAQLVVSRPAGRGAVRDLCERVLAAREIGAR
jgi:hypothetical protein